MNGIHDLGGMDGLGPIVIEANEPVFHSNWERQVVGPFFLTILKDLYNDDEFRQARESDSIRSSICNTRGTIDTG